MQKYISASMGVESTTLCLLYGKGAKAIVCDTGDEEPEMYERWDFVEQAMKIIHDGDFELIRIKPNVFAKGEYYNTLTDYALVSGVFPSSQMRYCTRKFKIAPIARNNCKVPKEDIHFALNHSDPSMKVTDLYIEEDFSIIDRANRKVIDLINKTK